MAFKHETRRALDKIREVEDVIYAPEDDTRVASTEKPSRVQPQQEGLIRRDRG